MGALQKVWVGYNIAISKWEFDTQIKYAKIIRKLQRDLGLELSDFKFLDKMLNLHFINNDYKQLQYF
jgi:hypothetical protein